jgi:CDGSH-type Zn-finger protein
MTMEKGKTVFKVNAGGPLEVSGTFEIKIPGKGKVIQKDTIYLCRCGGSSNKPFCDGSHKRNGFSG